MGRVVESVQVANFEDMLRAGRGELAEADVRRVQVDALVDTGATYLCLPPSVVEQLGLTASHTRRVKTANGDVTRRVFMGASITVQDRAEQMSVMENDAETPPLLGYLVLEALDLVVDPKAKKLSPNPEHDGKWMADLY